MRTEIGHHLLLASAEHKAVSKGRQTGADFDGAATSIVHNAILETPAVNVPCPAGDWAIDERCPEEQEDHHGDDAASLSDSTGCNGRSGGAELHLLAFSAHSPGISVYSRSLTW